MGTLFCTTDLFVYAHRSCPANGLPKVLVRDSNTEPTRQGWDTTTVVKRYLLPMSFIFLINKKKFQHIHNLIHFLQKGTIFYEKE
jgi:hypothetical protein